MLSNRSTYVRLKMKAQLMLAAYYGHADVVKFLIQHGADPNRLNDKRQSPLAGAVFKKLDDIVEVIKKLTSFRQEVLILISYG